MSLCSTLLAVIAVAPFQASEIQAAESQALEAPASEAVGEVLVVSPRDRPPLTASAASVTVLTGEDLARTGERSLPRAIGRAAGVVMLESNLGGGSPILRGLLGNQVLIVVDGVRLNDSTTRFGPSQSLNTIDPAIVERVEVRLGTSSVRYGSDAIGGVILIWTKRMRPRAASNGVGGALEGLYDTATRGQRGSLELYGAGSRHGWIGVVSGADWDDLRAGDGERQELTGYRTTAAFGSLEYALEEGRTLRAIAWVHRDFDVPRTFQVVAGFGQVEPPFAKYDFALQEREQSTLIYEDRAGNALADQMDLRLYARSYREQRARIRTGSSTEDFGETDVDTVGIGADFAREFGSAHRFSWGFEAIHDDVDSTSRRTNTVTGAVSPNTPDFPADSRYETFAAYAQDETRLLEPLLLTLGVRWTGNSFAFGEGAARERGSFDDLTASAVAAWDVTNTTRLTATLAQGFQAPNLEDLANDGDFAGGTEQANPDLRPAQSLMAEVGADVMGEAWSVRGAIFATRIEDALGRRLLDVGDPNVAGDELYQRANAGRLDLWGLELGADARPLGARSPWSVSGLVNWVRGRQYDDTVDGATGSAPLDGVESRRVPPLTGRVGLGWERPFESSAPRWFGGAGLALSFALDQDQLHPDDVTDPRIDPNGSDSWSIWTLDLRGAMSRSLTWELSLVNLLDDNYRVHGSAIDGPGRSAVLTVRASF